MAQDLAKRKQGEGLACRKPRARIRRTAPKAVLELFGELANEPAPGVEASPSSVAAALPQHQPQTSKTPAFRGGEGVQMPEPAAPCSRKVHRSPWLMAPCSARPISDTLCFGFRSPVEKSKSKQRTLFSV